MQYVNACLLMEAIMLELRVYYLDVLRYTIIANWDKVRELQNRGFYVQVKGVPRSRLGLDGGHHPDHVMSIEDDDVIVHREDGFGVHKLAEVRPDAEYHEVGIY